MKRAVPLALLLALLTLTACDVRAQDDAAPTAPTEATAQTDELSRSVRVIEAKAGALSVTRSASATIEPTQDSQISSAATGQVEAILADSGSQVSAGQGVIQLDDDSLRLQLDNAQLTLKTAQINLQKGENTSGSTSAQTDAALQAAETAQAVAQQQYDEGEKLLRAGGIAQTDFAQLEVALQQANAALIQAQAAANESQRAPVEDLELLRLQVQQAQTQIQQAEQALSDAIITAPSAGQVAEVLVNPGETVAAGSPAFRLVSTDQQQATFSVAPEDATALQEQGQIWLPYNGLDYAAQIRLVSQTANARLVEVTADLYPSQTHIPNGTVTQFDYDLTIAQGTLVPSAALRESSGQADLLVVEDGRAVTRNVTVKAEGGTQIAVEGVDAGAQVVYPRPADLTPGTAVTVVGGGS